MTEEMKVPRSKSFWPIMPRNATQQRFAVYVIRHASGRLKVEVRPMRLNHKGKYINSDQSITLACEDRQLLAQQIGEAVLKEMAAPAYKVEEHEN